MGGLMEQRISVGLALGVVFSLYYMFTWASGEHADLIKKSDFDELKNLMLGHTEEFRIVTASQIVRDKEMQLQIALATGKSDGEMKHIQNELSAARMYKACLIEQKPNCQHLKPPE